jgi:general secretion pathway protein L
VIEVLRDAAVRALNWWLEGLWLGLPDGLRAHWFRTRGQVIVRLSGDEAVIECSMTGAKHPPDSVTVKLDDPSAAEKVRAVCSFAEDADVTVVLRRPSALTKVLRLPAAAESALRDVLYHELDRLTPFTLADVMFDHHIRERAGDKIVVDVAVARREAPSAALAALERLQLRPTTITAEDAAGAVLPVNLLQTRPRLRVPFALPPVRLAYAAAFALALLAALYVPLLRYDLLLSRYQEAADEARKTAVAARTELQMQEAALARTDFLTARRHDYTSPLELLLELTNRLPESTWITRASFTTRQIQLQGESPAASELLQIVESTESLKDAQFQSPVSRSSESGKELFTLVAAPAVGTASGGLSP